MYVYLLGLAVSNLCVLITAVPALFEMGGVKLPTVGEVKHLNLSLLFQNKKTDYFHCLINENICAGGALSNRRLTLKIRLLFQVHSAEMHQMQWRCC